MKILVINSGSSSLKFQVIDSESEQVLAKESVRELGLTEGLLIKQRKESL